MTPVEHLRAARALIAAPQRWTQHCLARTSQRTSCGVYSPLATCFCAEGALRAANKGRPDALLPVMRLMREAIGTPHAAIDRWNDAVDRTHPQVVAAFDRAILLAEAEAC